MRWCSNHIITTISRCRRKSHRRRRCTGGCPGNSRGLWGGDTFTGTTLSIRFLNEAVTTNFSGLGKLHFALCKITNNTIENTIKQTALYIIAFIFECTLIKLCPSYPSLYYLLCLTIDGIS